MVFPQSFSTWLRRDAKFLVLYAIGANLYGLFLIQLDRSIDLQFLDIDQFLILLCIPVVYSIFLFSRLTFFFMALIGGLVSAWTLLFIDIIYYRESIQTVFVIFGVILCVGEIIYRTTFRRQKAEDELRKSEKWFRSVFDGSLDATFITDCEGRFIDVNPAAETLTGYDTEELKQMTVPDLNDEEDLNTYQDFFEGVSAGTPVTSEANILKKDGTKVATEFYNQKIEIEEVSYIHTVACRITERMRAEKQLHLLSSVVEQSTEGAALVDLDGNLLFANDAFASMHGYTPKELVGKHLSFFHTPEQMPSVAVANWQVRETGEFSGEIWHVRRDGTVFPVLKHNSLLRNEAGNPIGLIDTLRDISENKQTEEALRDSEKRYQNIVENTNDFVWHMDMDGIFTFASVIAERMYGYDPNDLLGKSFDLLLADESLQESKQTLKCRRKGDLGVKGTSLKQIHQRKDGTKFSAEIRTSPIFDPNGNPIEIVGITRDITERRPTKEELN